MALAAIEALLQASIGLSVASIGSAAIARAVEERAAACRLTDPQAYLDRLRGSALELQALIEAVIVPETWFFRDSHAFSTMARLARDEWLAAHPAGVMTLLSLPCSTGEEPYSMTMALLDGGVAGHRFRVDAVDISGPNITHATSGAYGRNSFRGAELGFRDRHFDKAGDRYHISAPVRRQVHFQQGNLFAADLLLGPAAYDVVFCRNVLIYFDRATQDRALGVLIRLLRPSGVLFVAPAETALPPIHGLRSTNEPLAFAFRRMALPPPKRRAAPPVKVLPALPALPRVTAAVEPPAPAPAADRAGQLAEITRLANQGHFVEAATRCEEHLQRWGASATAFCLLGLVRDASGSHSDAAAYYRKALYLEPDHYDALIHLALLLETQGDSAGARIVRNRSLRLEQAGRVAHD
jgi:chemotaxis protein methyltransferase WspC